VLLNHGLHALIQVVAPTLTPFVETLDPMVRPGIFREDVGSRFRLFPDLSNYCPYFLYLRKQLLKESPAGIRHVTPPIHASQLSGMRLSFLSLPHHSQ
jgi:hypothetical protein